MNVEAKKNELVKWILSLNEESLSMLDAFRKSKKFPEASLYNSKGNQLTEKQYKKHIISISDEVEEGATTYSSKEIKDAILSQNKR